MEIDGLAPMLSWVTLSALTLERYIAILHPYSYKTQVTKKKLLIYVGCGAVLPISLFFLFLHNPKFYHICVAAFLVLIFVCTAFAYTRIYLVVRKLSHSPNRPHDAASVENTTKMKVFLQNFKYAKSCFMIVVCFGVLCFLPGAITLFFLPNLKLYEREAVLFWVSTLSMLNSSVNSVIFFWTKTMLRNEAVKTLNNMCFM